MLFPRLARGAPSRRRWSHRHLRGRSVERMTRHTLRWRSCSRVAVRGWAEDASEEVQAQRKGRGLWNVGTDRCGDWNEKSSMLTDGGCSHCYLNASISMR